ncbi:MAG: hypothetical protein HOV80_24805 [Polyangiaceae bacterium]|nr:hypothetical protein [Polyangiaceae bacterium]
MKRDRSAKAPGARRVRRPRPPADETELANDHVSEDSPPPKRKVTGAPAPTPADVAESPDILFPIASALAAFGIAFWLYKTGAPANVFALAIAAGVAILGVHLYYSRSKRR